ncbi:MULTISPECIES: ParB/RepB/Spo0J family partition protein [unclassified Paraflavitalea]|uniref:ParB/RepB/Spo0J family partition protein n=1 Tax=unclassified Paraflavitalea TaxID=2798305 RepID=UPI003D34AFF2
MENSKLIPVDKIQPDPNQPRKTISQESVIELAGSIKAHGVLQPVTVRKKGKGYLLVFGHRRLAAALKAGLVEIPAIERDLTDEQALELQTIENLQREDIHPMEEAEVMLRMLDSGKSFEVIAAAIGKSEYYVRQRFKLNSLTEKWVDVFKKNMIDTPLAVKIANLNKEDQAELYNDQVDADDLLIRSKINIKDYKFDEFQCNLSNAPFDINSKSITKAGSCVNCKFNSETAQLFPDASKAYCTNRDCYKEKAEISFETRLNEAIEDPKVVFISSQWSYDKGLEKIAKKHGITVVTNQDFDCYEITSLEKNTVRDYAISNLYVFDDDLSEEEILAKAEKEVAELLAQFENDKANGKAKRGFYIDGSEKGTYAWVQMKVKKKEANTSSSSASTKAKEEVKTADQVMQEIDAEIKRLKDNEVRKQEISENKAYEEIHPHFSPLNNAKFLKEFLSDEEMMWVVETIIKQHYTLKEDVASIIGKKATSISAQQFNQVLRLFMFKFLPAHHNYVNDGFSKIQTELKMAEKYFPSVLAEIKTKYAAIDAKRKAKLENEIKKLQSRKTALKKELKNK